MFIWTTVRKIKRKCIIKDSTVTLVLCLMQQGYIIYLKKQQTFQCFFPLQHVYKRHLSTKKNPVAMSYITNRLVLLRLVQMDRLKCYFVHFDQSIMNRKWCERKKITDQFKVQSRNLPEGTGGFHKISRGRDFNQGPPENEAVVPTTRLRCSKKLCYKIHLGNKMQTGEGSLCGCHLGCWAVWSGSALSTFQRCWLPPPSLRASAVTYEMSINVYQTTQRLENLKSHLSGSSENRFWEYEVDEQGQQAPTVSPVVT